MKLRRMKLVALAMSALMVTSALPMTAFAEEDMFFEEVADEALVGESVDEEFYVEDEDADFIFEEDYDEEEVVGAEPTITPGAVDSYQAKNVKWDVDEEAKTAVVTYQLYNKNTNTLEPTWYENTTDAVFLKEEPAKCEKRAAQYFKITLYGEEFYSGACEYGDPGEHDWQPLKDAEGKDISRNITTYPTCTEDGEGTMSVKCSICGKVDDTHKINDGLEKLGHNWGAVQTKNVAKNTDEDEKNIAVDEDGEIIFESDGKAKLVDRDKDGKYYEVKYAVCTRDAKHVIYYYKDAEGKDVTKVVENTTLDKDGNPVVDSQYGVPVLVLAKAEKTAKIDTKSIKNIATDIGTDPAKVPSKDKIELEDCSKDGSYVIEYFNANGRPVSQETVTVPAHHFIKTVIEFKNQTDKNQCTVKGTTVINNNCARDIPYYVVEHCVAKGVCAQEKCGIKKCDTKKYLCEDKTAREVSRTEKVATKSNQHIINTTTANAIAGLVKANPNGVDYHELEKLAYYKGDKESEKKTDLEKAQDTGSYIVISSNTATCTEAGEATVDYICKICGTVVKQERVKTLALGHDEKKPERKVIKDATCTEEGLYDATIYCARCGIALHEERNVIIPKTPHTNVVYDDKKSLIGFDGAVVVDTNSSITAGKVVKSNDAKPYLGVSHEDQGIYEDFFVTAQVFTLCDNCKGNKNINKNAAWTIKVDSIEKSQYSCLAGKITLTATYKRANKEVISVTESFPYYTSIHAYQGRSQHDPETLADGTVKCKVCGTVIKEGSGEQGGETPAECKHENVEAVTENVKDSTCTEAGSYDVVTKCKDCEKTISTMHVITPAKGHDFGAWKTTSRATVFAAGKQTRTCALCKKSETKSLAKLPSIIKLNKSAVTVKVGKYATVKVSKWNLKDYIAPTAEGGVKSGNKSVASAFKAGSYLIKVRGIKAGTTNVTVKMKAGATTTFKVTVKK